MDSLRLRFSSHCVTAVIGKVCWCLVVPLARKQSAAAISRLCVPSRPALIAFYRRPSATTHAVNDDNGRWDPSYITGPACHITTDLDQGSAFTCACQRVVACYYAFLYLHFLRMTFIYNVDMQCMQCVLDFLYLRFFSWKNFLTWVVIADTVG